MYDKKQMIDSIIDDWSYRVENGTPNIKDYNHREILKDIFKEHDIPSEAIGLIIRNLNGEPTLLNEVNSAQSITATTFFGREKSHTTKKKSHQKIIDPYQVQNALPVQKSKEDEEELEADGQKNFQEIQTFIFDPDQMKIVETGNQIPLEEVVSENKYKCFATGDVYLETKNNTLVKEKDYEVLNKLTEEEKKQLITNAEGE